MKAFDNSPEFVVFGTFLPFYHGRLSSDHMFALRQRKAAHWGILAGRFSQLALFSALSCSFSAAAFGPPQVSTLRPACVRILESRWLTAAGANGASSFFDDGNIHREETSRLVPFSASTTGGGRITAWIDALVFASTFFVLGRPLSL